MPTNPIYACTELQTRLQVVRKLGSIITWELDISENKVRYQNADFDPSVSDCSPEIDFEEMLEKFIHAEHKEIIRTIIRDAIRTGRIDMQEIRLRNPDESERYFRINGRSIMDTQSRILVVGALQDITDWRRAQRSTSDNLRFLKILGDTISYPIFFKDKDLIYRYCNKTLVEQLGTKMEKIIGRKASDLFPADQAELITRQDLEVLEKKQPMQYRSTLFFGNQQSEILFNRSLVTDSEDNIMGVVSILFDITELSRSQELSDRLERIKDLVMAVNNAILEKSTLSELFDFIVEEALNVMEHADCGCILTLNDKQMLEISAYKGYRPQDVKGFQIPLEDTFQWKLTNGKIDSVLIINDLDSAFDPEITDSLIPTDAGRKLRSTISSPILLGDKIFGFIHIDSSNNNIFTDDDRYLMEYFRGQLANSIEKFKLYENMVYLSNHDPQTDFYNRRYFNDIMGKAIEKGNRYDEHFLVASFDIDGLKAINDSLGHLAGDELIRKFAAALKTRCRSTDVLARTGGDEFIAIIYNADADEMHRKFEMLKNHFSINPIRFGTSMITCSFSFGIARFPEDGVTYDALISKADQRMYADKTK